MGVGLKPKVVLSGVNLVDMGPLNIFRAAIQSAVQSCGQEHDIFAIVHTRELFDTPGVTYIEFPEIKSSWFRRIWFEYVTLQRLSKTLSARLWLSMHDTTPNVTAEVRAVYCHNPSPFYRLRLNDVLLDPRFALFALFYKYLYRLNIERNQSVIVQQDWLRRSFEQSFGLRNVIVARPSVDEVPQSPPPTEHRSHSRFIFFYPAFPRTFKNFELLLEAVWKLEQKRQDGIELWLTFDGSENRYAASLRKKYTDVRSVRWLGLLPRKKVFEAYGEANCLVFPSRLETWGLPITEFKTTGKPILAADLPYAHETVGNYGQAAFFDPYDSDVLADLMDRASTRENVFAPSWHQDPVHPYARNWAELWPLLLAPLDSMAEK